MNKNLKILTILADFVCELVLIPFHVIKAILDIYNELKR